MLLFLSVLTRCVVGRLGCDKHGGAFVVADRAKCWVGDMNAVFNGGEELMSYCGNGVDFVDDDDGWVRSNVR